MRHHSAAATTVARSGLPEEAVDAALDELAHASDLRDPERPFLQMWGSDPEQVKAKAKEPAWRLNPWRPTKDIDRFWDLRAPTESVMSQQAATLALVCHWGYMHASNASHIKQGQGTVWNTPGAHATGDGENSTNTEILWGGDTLLATLLLNTPRSWVDDGGLPGWADLRCERSLVGGQETPLWKATWSANSPLVAWDDSGQAVGVKLGGNGIVPPSSGADRTTTTGKKKLAEWRKEQVNPLDPLYLYKPVFDKDGNLVKRVSLRFNPRWDHNEMVTMWHHNRCASIARQRRRAHLLTPGRGTKVVLLQHMYGGSNNGMRIDSSTVTEPAEQRAWLSDRQTERTLREASGAIITIRDAMRSMFHPKGSLGSVTHARPVAIATYWRNVGAVFDDIVVNHDPEGGRIRLTDDHRRTIRNAALDAIEEATQHAMTPRTAPDVYRAIARLKRLANEELGLNKKENARP